MPIRKLESLLALATAAVVVPARVDANAAVTDLPPMVVVATRTPLPLDQASPSVGLLRGDELLERQVAGLAESLATLPGFHAVSSGQAGSLVSVFTRGTNSDHTAMLFEGRRLPGGFSGFYGISFLGLDPGMGLEVHRGPASFLHGADGIGGALNLVGGGLSAGPGTTSGIAEATYGSFGTATTRGAVATRVDRFGVEAGWVAMDTDNDQPNAAARRTQGRVSVRGSLAHDLRADVHVIGWTSELGLPDNRKAQGYPKLDDYEEDRGWMVTPGLTWAPGDWELTLHAIAAGDRVRARNTFVFGTPPTSFAAHDFYETTSLGASVLASRRLGDRGLWSGGFDLLARDLRQVDLVFGGTSVDDDDRSAAAWTQVQVQLAPGWSASGGLRVDHTEDYDTPVTGAVQLAWTPTVGWSVFAKAGSAYAAPQPLDLYGTFGNPLLDAERSLSLEAGVKGRLAGASLDLVAFHNRIRDLISYDPATFTTSNIGRARTRGVEVAGSVPLGAGFSAGATLTLLEAENRVDGTRLLRRPSAVALGWLGWANGTLSLRAEVRQVADREDVDGGTFARIDAGDFTVVRLLAEGEIAEGWTLFGRIENALDATYDEVDGFAALGRGAHVGLRRRW